MYYYVIDNNNIDTLILVLIEFHFFFDNLINTILK